jgi:hypothetical protein
MSECINPYYTKAGVPCACGQCPSCLAKRKREWTLRLRHEAESFTDSAVFVTLTYNEQSNPGTLVKDHYQRFLKRLRSRFPGQVIRYYFVGEYGGKTSRPHYHAILYGLKLIQYQPYQPFAFKCAPKGKRYMVSALLDELWQYGYNTIGSCTANSIAYVAGYCQKKIYTNKGSYYKDRNQLPPFAHMSRGIGLDYAFDHEEALKRDLVISVDGYMVSIPRYYRKKLGIDASFYTDLISRLNVKMMIEYSEDTGVNPIQNYFSAGDNIDSDKVLTPDSLYYSTSDNYQLAHLYYDSLTDSYYSVTTKFLRWLHQHAINSSMHVRKKVDTWHSSF